MPSNKAQIRPSTAVDKTRLFEHLDRPAARAKLGSIQAHRKEQRVNDQPQTQPQEAKASDTSATVRVALLLAALTVPILIVCGIVTSPYHPYPMILVGVFVELVFAHLWFAPLFSASR